MTNILPFTGKHLPLRAENHSFDFYRVDERYVVINKNNGISYDICREDALDMFGICQKWKKELSA